MKAAASDRAGRRIRLSHHVVELAGGQSVGMSVGGHGPPMVFLHGLGLSRRAYLRLLSRIAGLGFLVVAMDAPGHGDTRDLPCTAGEFTDRVDLMLRALDAIGIDQAIFAAHSMGGRMAIHLAAAAPHRTLAVVLFDAAAGASFDAAVRTVMRSPRQLVDTVVGALCDLQRDPMQMRISAIGRYLRMATAMVMGGILPQTGFTGAAQAIARSGECTPLLRALRDRQIPTIVLHGASDTIVPFQSARDVADDANATLYRIPEACHSWLISNPRHGADAVRQLLDGPLGEVLRTKATQLGIADWRDIAAWESALIGPDAKVRSIDRGTKLLDTDENDPVGMDVVRRADRPSRMDRIVRGRIPPRAELSRPA